MTGTNARSFRRAIEEAEVRPVPDGVDPRIAAAEVEGMRSQLASLEQEVAEHDALTVA